MVLKCFELMWIVNFVLKISIKFFTDIKYRCFLHLSHISSKAKMKVFQGKAKLVLNIFHEIVSPQMTIRIVLK